MIVKRQDEHDRRVFLLELTDEGRNLMESLGFRREQVIKDMFEKLSVREQENIVMGIRLLAKSLADS